ncbi:hypothetical protein BY458DRAFT_467671 [Sporodiniella umbellata]|nr:hypothetical protein BY458DRAFT_467671 [Sporodiniella umbellata]
MSLSFARLAAKSQRAQILQRTAFKGTVALLRPGYYSTAAVDTDKPSPKSKHVFLPNPGLDSFKTTARVLPSSIAEQFAILNACISTGSMERAERIMAELYKTKLNEMKIFADVNLYNFFLNGFIETPRPMTKECLLWFDNMKAYGLAADADTYAIIVKGFIRSKSYHTARALLQEMTEVDGIEIDELLLSAFLTKSDITLFRTLISESRGSSVAKVEALLQKLESATDKILGEEAEPIMKDIAKTPIEPMEDIPEVKATDSIGVHFLQEQLSALRDPKSHMKADTYEIQLSLERQGYEMALQKLIHNKEQSVERGDILNAMHLTPLKRIMWKWHQNMTALVEEEIKRCDNPGARDSERRQYGPFLKLLPVNTVSIVTILELLRLHNSSSIGDGMKTTRAILDVGKAVEMEYNAVQMKKNSRSQEFQQVVSSGKLFNMAVNKAQRKTLITDDELKNWNPIWPIPIRAKVGSVLTSLLLESAKIPVPSWNPETGEKITEEIPAFFHTYQYVLGKRVGIIKFADQLTEMLSREPIRDTLHPRLLPMLVAPRPWISYNSGGYLSTKSMCMRTKDSVEQQVYLQKASETDLLKDVLGGLDVLGSTRWRVNKNVFKIILEAWNSGEPIADIPPALGEPVPLPPKPENYHTDPKAKFNWINEIKQIQTTERNNHSLRCDVNYKVETARAYLNLPMFFPHNMDFRGRAYPMPPTLNHLGNDLCRGLLHFEEAKPLGERGWKWLKIHLANLYGYDKHSFTDREKFTVENMANIMDSVDNPLTGQKWWLQADAPWQCLSACYEVAAAVRSGKPEEFLSQLPVHQDGTCNGLQHYAALGGDLAGARAVNLAAGDRPADVYTGVADMVNKHIDAAAEKGDENAKLLQGNVSRKVVKQTVMTNVYGVTFIGARSQIENRLKENPAIPRDKVYALSTYLAKAVFSSLGEMFNGARQIQDWLTDSARRIAKSIPTETLEEAGLLVSDPNSKKMPTFVKESRKKKQVFSARSPSSNQMTSVIWTTPLGLPIVQPYRRSGKKQVATLLQTVYIEDPDASRPVNTIKQSTAFPPNFIHSLDATHMLMSALACNRKGLTFASVHDSYWTHACHVDSMNEVIREQFIELHSQPIMENLLEEFQERYKNFKVPITKLIGSDKGKELVGDEDGPIVGPTLFGNPEALEKELLGEQQKKKGEKKDAFKAIFGIEAEEENVTDDTDDIDDIEGAESLLNEDDDSPKAKKAAKKSNQKKYEHVWESLTFLPLPPKGEFDINEVKKSQYFFH